MKCITKKENEIFLKKEYRTKILQNSKDDKDRTDRRKKKCQCQKEVKLHEKNLK